MTIRSSELLRYFSVETSKHLHRNVYEELIMDFRLSILKPILYFETSVATVYAELHPRRTESSIAPL
jgi:hypothetical protein